MSHFQQLQFVSNIKDEFPSLFHNTTVLEVGSWDRNGSVRNYFSSCNYLGVDVLNGPGVDEVSAGQDLSCDSNSFDVVISCECFEHNPHWQLTFANMIRMLKPGGTCIITCASLARGEHGTMRSVPDFSLTSVLSDVPYYANLTKNNFIKTGFLSSFCTYRFSGNIYSKDLYFIGIKETGAICDSCLEIKLDNIINLTKKVKMETPVTLASEFRFNFSWMIRASIESLLGETNYHDTVYLLKQILRKK